MTSNMENNDVLIVGAGPAGAFTAYELAKRTSKKILLIDARAEVGVPPRCAGGITKRHMDELNIEPPESVIASRVTTFRLFPPNKQCITFKSPTLLGWTVYRDRFDQWLVDLAVSKGVTLNISTRFSDSLITGHNILACGSNWQLISKFGFYTPNKSEVHHCIQYTIESSVHQKDALDMYFDTQLFPGGYGWVFPEGSDRARVGLGIAGQFMKRRLLNKNIEKFIKQLGLRGSKVICKTGKIIPTVYSGSTTHRIIDGKWFFVVGDAGCMVDPLTGGGIANAMQAARVLARCIAEGHEGMYDQSWRALLDRKMSRQQSARKFFMKMSNYDLNELAKMLEHYSHNPTSHDQLKDLSELVYEAIKRHPWKATKLMWKLGWK